MRRLAIALAFVAGLFFAAPAAHAQYTPPANGSTQITPAPDNNVSSSFAGVSPTTSPSRPVGKVLGLIALVVVLVLFAEGYGILGGRIRNLASRPPRVRPGSAGDA